MAATRRLLVRGRVRGTRMAEALAAEATALSLTGWVQERGDGRIEAIVQGEADLVAALIDWATRGTTDAWVSAVEIADTQGVFDRFELRAAQEERPVTRRLVVHGHVQGVGFRDALRARAQALELAGWVRNRSDGTVEAIAQGMESRVQSLVDWAHRGPPSARVTRVEVDASVDQGNGGSRYVGFERRPTL